MERNEIERMLQEYGKKEIVQRIVDGRISFEDAVDINVMLAEDEFLKLKPDPLQIAPFIKKGKKEHSFGLSLRHCPWNGDYINTDKEPSEDYYLVTINGNEYKVRAVPIAS